MRTQHIFDSFAATACVIGLVFACSASNTTDPPNSGKVGAGSTNGEGASENGVGGSGASSSGGKSGGGGVLKGSGGDDGSGADSGSSAAPGDDDDDSTATDDDDDTSSASGGTGSDDDDDVIGAAGYAYNPDDGTGADTTDDPGDDVTDDPGSGGGATDDPPKGGDTGDPPPDDTGDPGTGGDTGDPGTGGATADPPDECVPTDIAQVNVIVFGDATPNGADSEGTMWVAGDASFDGYAIGSKNTKDCDTYSLVVGGDLTGSGNANNGKLWVGGEYDASVNFTDCGVNQDQPGPVDFVALETKMVGISLALAAYPVNGTVDDSTGSLKFVGTDAAMNIFSVTAEQIELANEIVLDVPLTSTAIINVSGTELVFSGKGFKLPDGVSCRGGTTDFCSHIVWNMPEMEVLQAAGVGIQGSVYAPYAAFSGNGGNVDGQLVVRSLTGGIEFHPYYFNGCLELPVGISISG